MISTMIRYVIAHGSLFSQNLELGNTFAGFLSLSVK